MGAWIRMIRLRLEVLLAPRRRTSRIPEIIQLTGGYMENSTAALRGKTALVTGAARRLGRAIALALAGEGADVVVHYNRSREQAETLCHEVEALGVSAWAIRAELAEADQTERLFEEATSQAGPIDILVNNASMFERDTVWDATDESVWLNLRVHAMAPLVLSRRFAEQRRTGHIVNILDTRVTTYDRQHASYHISKRVMATLTRMLALELAPAVAVNAVAPGLVLPPAGQDDSYLERLAHCNPMNTHGAASDVAEAVLFLLRTRFTTGQVLYVDGGYHMKGHMYD